MAGSALDVKLPQLRGDINVIIKADRVHMPEELRKIAGGASDLAHLYGCKFFKPLIQAVLNEVFLDNDQQTADTGTGSLKAHLHCLVAKRFLEVLDEYESGRMKERLEKEFSEYCFTLEGLNVEIENMKEVDERKEVIKQYKRPVIIVQGGVYFENMSMEEKNEFKEATVKSAKTGYTLLMEGRTAVDAVEAAVRVLEEDEKFNAGRGSSLNKDNQVECDAMIMEGHTLESGAVTCGSHFRYPVSLAKRIMKKSDHCAFSGNGALKFAREQNFQLCDPKELVATGETPNRESLERSKSFSKAKPGQETETVSAVAMDAYGHLACAMSTGGLLERAEGRVSDVAMIGCGGYANETGAATASGPGESIIKVTLAREVVFNMEKGCNVEKSAENGLKKMDKVPSVKSYGAGVIAIDKDGNFGKDFTTDMMVWASIKDDEVKYGMDRKEFITTQYK